MSDVPDENSLSFPRLIALGISTKLMIDTSNQLFNPFLNIIAAGLGTDTVTLGRLIGLRSAMGLVTPLLGGWADRYGYRRILQAALLLAALGMLLIGVSQTLWVVTIGMMISGIGIASFVPNLHAYLSARLPYARRGRALGMIEYAWALTGILGLSVMGLVIDAYGWRLPFYILAALLLVMAVVFGRLPASGARSAAAAGTPRSSFTLRAFVGFFDLGEHARSCYSSMAVAVLTYFSGVQLMIVHGVWLSADYGLSASQLGGVALILGFFDLAASVSVSLFTDRIGKRRSVILGSIGALIAYLLLPLFNTGLVSAVIAIAVARSFFEFAIVSYFPLLSEQVPEQRGKVMSLSTAFVLSGGAVASMVGPWVYRNYGIAGLSLSAALPVALALVIAVVAVRERAAFINL